MCIFSGPVGHVKNTRIFARLPGTGTQFLVYSMSYAADREVAMILPIPIGSRDENTAVRFIALDDYVNFFDDMVTGFPDLDPANRLTYSMNAASASLPTLRVHDVGVYEASFVPTLFDFDRLDARFKLPDTVWHQMPQYTDYGFVVFKLRVTAEESEEDIHPIAFEFVTRHGDSLYFPTVHVHDGQFHISDTFDHHLYYQGVKAKESTAYAFYKGHPVFSLEELIRLRFKDMGNSGGITGDFEGSERGYISINSASDFVDVQKAKGIVSGEDRCYALVLYGLLQNKDTFLTKGTVA
jgi:hypothetical protein